MPRGFEDLYIALRKKEVRIYTDEELAQLPAISHLHIHYDEWKTRKRSAEKLLQYLQRKAKPLRILEAGCGNGWLSARLSAIRNTSVTGSDINGTELSQAKKVFSGKSNLDFVQEDIRNPFFDTRKYDIIIFAASVQYFASFEKLIQRALSLLEPGGEIHILDTFLYRPDELQQAKKRTEVYFDLVGFPEMTEYYFHHSIDSLKNFRHSFLFRPGSLAVKIFTNARVFPWICITNK
jgi:SAM-dependent methyltransferase